MKVNLTNHPLIHHKVSLMRNVVTSSKEFRELVNEVSMLMCYEVTRDLPLMEVEIDTPMGKTKTKVISGKKLAVVPILRAGLGMVDGIVNLIPSIKVGHIGLYRDPESLNPVEYYCKLPSDIAQRDVLLLDPMVATGGTSSAAIQFLKNYGVKNIKLMSIIAVPDSIKKINEEHPDVEIYAAAIDEKLDENGYILPGLGDMGDRIFGTK